jgi:hemolysin-activating ACP:hemolysin acyltransferase
MQKSFLEIGAAPSNEQRARFESIGYAAYLVSMHRTQRLRQFTYIQSVVEPALMHEFIKFYFNSEGTIVGFAIWAFLAPDVELRVMATGQLSLHLSEWNEGQSAWIIDIVAIAGHAKRNAHSLQGNIEAA